jgi:hypothetical protein
MVIRSASAGGKREANMSDQASAIDAFQTRSLTPSLGYIVATRPHIEKAVGGVVHATSEDAFTAKTGMGPEGSAFDVFEVLVYVARDPMPPAMKFG